eukprot:m.66640 g.66640  ORF g.66640 m.66640 type:complete len:590 (+) comp8372_c0_seq2:93-1862(+)
MQSRTWACVLLSAIASASPVILTESGSSSSLGSRSSVTSSRPREHPVHGDMVAVPTKPPFRPGRRVVEIMTRDGVNLHTEYALPGRDDRKYPAVIDRSPYGDTNTELIADIFLPFGFAAINQDFRGTKKSGGKFDLWRESYNDTEDTINWIVAQPWSNGVVHFCGASADGIAGLVMAAQPPIQQIKNQFIIFATGDPYKSVFVGGVFRYALIDGWLHGTLKHSQTDPDVLEAEVFKHESPLDPWWTEVTPNYADVKAPTVFWSGWYDIFLNGNIEAFDGWQNATNGQSWLLIDALGHCQRAHGLFPHAGIDGRVAVGAEMGISMFLGDLNDPAKTTPQHVKHLTFFVMGSNLTGASGGYYTTMDTWPVYTTTCYYMHGDHSLQLSVPETTASSLTFAYDPKNPVPSHGGNNMEIDCGPRDQRPVENRSDVLLFTSDALVEPLPVVGKITVTLTVSSKNVNDTDWTAKLTDVFPDGTSRLIQDGILRMRWRNMGRYPEPILPNVAETIEISLWYTAYIFDPGHRIRIAVSSSNSPRFLANPNTGIPLSAPQAEPIVAINTLHTGGLDAATAPHVSLPVVAMSDLPKHFII